MSTGHPELAERTWPHADRGDAAGRPSGSLSFVSIVDGHEYELVRSSPEGAVVRCSPEASRPPGAELHLSAPEAYPTVAFRAEVRARFLPRHADEAELHLRWVEVTETRSRSALVKSLQQVLGLKARVRNPELDALSLGGTLVYDAESRQVRLVKPEVSRNRSRRRLQTLTQRPRCASPRILVATRPDTGLSTLQQQLKERVSTTDPGWSPGRATPRRTPAFPCEGVRGAFADGSTFVCAWLGHNRLGITLGAGALPVGDEISLHLASAAPSRPLALRALVRAKGRQEADGRRLVELDILERPGGRYRALVEYWRRISGSSG